MRALLCLLAVLSCATAATAAAADWPRPAHTEHAQLARWLAHTAQWGTISAWDAVNQRPVGGVASFSDGPPDSPTGRLYFFLTPMDETTQHITSYPACSFTVAEAQLQPNGCSGTDPEDPTCAKITVIGEMQHIASAEEADAAAAALFSRHAAMQQWPADHGFTFFELKVTEVHMLDWYGGMHIIPGSDYYAAELAPPSAAGSGQRQQRRQWRVQQALWGGGSAAR